MARHRHPDGGVPDVHRRREAHAYVDARGAPIVVKADGLAAGKGVVVARDRARSACRGRRDAASSNAWARRARASSSRSSSKARKRASSCIADGQHALPLATSQDHKRLLDGDRGPNTGGMGAYSPAPVVTPAVHARIMREVIDPAIAGMAADGTPYTGFLYAGLMIDAAGNLKVLEFNCRLGDPETQPILMRLKSDLVDAARARASTARSTRSKPNGTARPRSASCSRRPAIPAPRAKGDAISGLAAAGERSTCTSSTRATALDGDRVVDERRARAVRDRARPLVRTAQQRAYDAIVAASASTACSTAATSGIARFDLGGGAVEPPPLRHGADRRSRLVAIAVDIAPVRSFFSGLQARIVAALEALDGGTFRRDAVAAAGRRRRRSRCMLEDGAVFERAGVGFSHVHGDEPAAVGLAHRAGARGPRVRSDGRVARAASAQSVRADGASERALLRRDRRPARRRCGGSAAAWI